MCPFVVPWPTSIKMFDLGFKDSYRMKYPDEVSHPGITWFAPVADWEFHGQRMDRLDFIYYMNAAVETVEILETKFSDHRALLGQFNF